MKICKRTFFNKLFQPYKIGRQMRRRLKPKCEPFNIKITKMSEFRRAHQGQRNAIIGRHAVIKLIKLRRKYIHIKRGSNSFMIKRARL